MDANEVVANSIDDVEINFFCWLSGNAFDDTVDAQLLIARLWAVAGRQRNVECIVVVRRIEERIGQRHLLRLTVFIDDREGLADQ